MKIFMFQATIHNGTYYYQIQLTDVDVLNDVIDVIDVIDVNCVNDFKRVKD
jgi:hypothetical protein